MKNLKDEIEGIRIITIGIEKAPRGCFNPVWLTIKPNPVALSVTFGEGLDMVSEKTTHIISEYPLEHFAVGDEQRPLYIRTKDKDAFLELLNGWIDKVVEERVEQEKERAVREFIDGFLEHKKTVQFKNLTKSERDYLLFDYKQDFEQYLAERKGE